MAANSKRHIVIYKNPEKLGHGASKDPFIPGVPFRMMLVGPPGSGKRVALLNVLESLETKPTRIVVLHGDPGTVEYRGITKDVRAPEDVPTFEELVGEDAKERDEHKLVIIDEVPWDGLSRAVRTEFERLFNHRSTHGTTSVILCYQQATGVPAAIRRAMQHYILFKSIDLRETSDLALRFGLTKEVLRELMEKMLRDKYDSLWVDTTAEPGAPHRLRLNLWQPIMPRVDLPSER